MKNKIVKNAIAATNRSVATNASLRRVYKEVQRASQTEYLNAQKIIKGIMSQINSVSNEIKETQKALITASRSKDENEVYSAIADAYDYLEGLLS